MKTDIRHGITPDRLGDVVRQPKVARNKHEYSLIIMHKEKEIRKEEKHTQQAGLLN